MAPKFKDGDVVFSFNGKWVAWTHTAVAYFAFLGALIVGCWLHYYKIVQNEHFGYPDEWFPSVSATIGDRYPERSVFMVFIAITSGPRFALCALWYFLTRRPNSNLPMIITGVGIFRTFTCGGWTYITSTDDHHWHDIFMVSYLVATIPWTLGCLALSPPNPQAVKYRKILAGLFFGTLVPLTYFFIQHKVHKVAGAYTTYAFFEWAMILFDVGFDAVTVLDFSTFEIVVKDVHGLSRGDAKLLKDSVKEKDKAMLQASTFDGPYSWPNVLDALADVFNGYVFWSMLTSLGLSIWYFPLWYMGLSGYEALVMVSVSPLFLAIPFVRSSVIQNIRWVHMASLAGLAAWLVKDPANRLFCVSFGVGMSCTAWTATWYAERGNVTRLQSRILAWTIGLTLSSISKFANYTNNPIWPILNAENGGWNKVGLVLAIGAVWRSTRRVMTSGGDHVGPANTRKGSSWLAAFGLGGILFAMHSLLSDSSTMILWVWEGFPVQGPIAAPHGAVTILAMALGTFLGTALPGFFASWTAYGAGAVGAALLTCYSHWTGYYGALIMTVYIMGVAPTLITSALQHNLAITFGFGFLVYNFMVLFSIWTVAYAFVPGGPLVRERTDWVMITMMLMIGAGVFSALVTNSPQSTKGRKPVPRSGKQSAYYLHILLALQLLSFSIAYLRFPTNDYKPYHPEDKVMTAGIWTIHFSLDNDMWSSEQRMRDAIRDLELDVIGLLESDTQRIIMGNRDFTQYIAEDLGMYVDFGPGPNKNTWGAALLSKFPILNSTHHLTPSPVGELAPAIEATLDVYGTEVDVFVFHSGQEEDPEDRRLQSEYMSRIMGQTSRPAILLSYLVTKPKEGNYNNYVSKESEMRDIDASDWDRWCEYILYKNIKRTGYARISRGTITDTEIQAGKFVVGEAPDYTDRRIPEEQVPPGLRFPALFQGEGVRGHRYHVFDEPRYFA